MRAVVQRVSRASVVVDGSTVGAIDTGLLVLLGTLRDDMPEDTSWMVKKLLGLRIFSDADGKMNRSVVDVGGSILLVSQFTVCADVGKGNRPSFMAALAPEEAKVVLEQVRVGLAAAVPVATGSFGAHMEVSLVNDGPVTIWLDSQARGPL